MIKRLTNVIGQSERYGKRENLYSIANFKLECIREIEEACPNVISGALDYLGGEKAEVAVTDKLGKLEDIEESMGVDLIVFLSELLFVLSNCNETVGYTTDRKPISADYGYVEDFINRLKEAVK